MGIPITPSQASTGSGTGFLAKNFFKVFAVIPFIGKPGREGLLKNYREFLFPAGATAGNKKTFSMPGDTLQPSTTAAFIYGQASLGAEAAAKIGQNYKDNIALLRDNHRTLLNEAIALENPQVIPTTNVKRVLAEMKDELRGQTNNLYQAYLKGDLSPEKLTRAEKQAVEQD